MRLARTDNGAWHLIKKPGAESPCYSAWTFNQAKRDGHPIIEAAVTHLDQSGYGSLSFGGISICATCQAAIQSLGELKPEEPYKTTEEQLFPVVLNRQRPERVWHWRIRLPEFYAENTSNWCQRKGFDEQYCSDPENNIITFESPAELHAVIAGAEPMLRHDYICLQCLRALREAAAKHPDMKKEITMSQIDATKPLIVRRSGSPQFEQVDLIESRPDIDPNEVYEFIGAKTLKAAKDRARQITEEEGVSVTVLTPHTTYKRKSPPIEEITHKKTP
jgi:hypothetical protein